MNYQQLSVVSAVNDDHILTHNLQRSELIVTGEADFHFYRGFRCAGTAYNKGLHEANSDIIIFVHQDVYLPSGWPFALKRAIAAIEEIDPEWAVLGAFGLNTEGRAIGRVWSSGLGRLLGEPLEIPEQVICLDELLLVLRRDSGLRFDEKLPGFHLYGTDIVMQATTAGLKAYVADLPVVHNSRPVLRLKADYGSAYAYMRRKWRSLLPWPTLIVPLTRTGMPLLRARIRMLRSRRKSLQRAVDADTDPRAIARRIGLE